MIEGERRGRGIRLVGVVVGVVLALGCLLLWREHATTKPPAIDAPVPVNVEVTRARDVPITMDANGVVTSLAVAPVKPRIDGQLVAIAFQEAQDVHKGQLLAQIDPRPYQALVAQADAAVRRDRALAADLRANQSRAEQLATLGAGPTQSADTLRAQAAAAEATIAADTAAATNARLNLDFTRVTSPIDGRAGLRQVDRGTIVRTSDPTPLVSITQMAPISIIFAVPQGRLGELQDAQGHGPVGVTALLDGNAVATGQVAAIDSAVDPASGQVKLRAVFANADRKLWPGELITVRIALRTLRKAVTVSDTVVLNGQTGPYVYRVDGQGVADVKQIATGPSVGGFTVIANGLAAGDKVVSRGQSRLKPGSHISSDPQGR